MKGTFKAMVVAGALALSGAAGTALAQLAPNVVLEASVETTTDQVIFPADAAGRVQVRNCKGCLLSTLQLDARTQYNLAGQKVTLKDMAAFARSVQGRPLDIHYRLSDKVVSLVSVLTK